MIRYPEYSSTDVYRHLIDGQLESSAACFDVINPATGAPFARCPDASEEQFERAVAAARRAQVDWCGTTRDERYDALARFAQTMEDHTDELAALLTREQGKPLAAARAEIARAVLILRHLITLRIEPEILESDASGRVELHFKPLGVIGAITPWNVPIVLAAPKIASALYTGNTLILKPSPYTPLTTLRLGELAQTVFPRGVLNVLAGGNELGGWMTAHPEIAKINFTGSVPTGKAVMAAAARNMKRVTLELGGNDAAIVLSDADPKAIAPDLFRAAFANSGQVCQAIKRLYVHEDLYEALVAELADLARRARVGDGADPDTELGPLQNKAQYDKVLDVLAETRALRGVRIAAGGAALDRPGYFIAPTIVADVVEGARVVDEETFGPVLPVLRFGDVDDAIRRANASRFGLGGSIWTRDAERGAQLAARLDTGVAWVNHHLGLSPAFPFGGVKESGIGRTNSLMGLKSNMEAQVVVVPAR